MFVSFEAVWSCQNDGNACQLNDQTGEGGFPCAPGFAPFTHFFMGGIHPRAYVSGLPFAFPCLLAGGQSENREMVGYRKRVVGQRLAMAARNLVYGDQSTPYTGETLGCKAPGSRQLLFC